MDFTKLTAADFRRITQLLEEKESLRRKIADIDRVLEGYNAGNPAESAPRRGPKPGKPAAAGAAGEGGEGQRQKRGQLKENIIALLKEAGAEGLSVKDVAVKLQMKPVNIHAWFGSTGKKVAEIKNTNGKRVWVGAA